MMEVRGGRMKVEEGMSGAWYFHGWLPRWEVERALTRDGDFLALEEQMAGVPVTVVAVRRAQTVLYFRMRLGMDGQMHSEAGRGFDCLATLVAFYQKEKRALVEGSGAVPRRPVGLLPWQVLPEELRPPDGAVVRLGQGCFGDVNKATLVPASRPSARRPVAVKECQTADPAQRQAFFKEAHLHLRACKGCPFIVEMVGLCGLSGSLRAVLELLPLGDLATWLKKEGKTTEDAVLLGLARDLALALAHLSQLGIIHLDIAARNCLLKASPLRLLLGDFGLARLANVYQIQEGDFISKRWAAPETLKSPGGMASRASDVWSWGVVLWELWSAASVPYPELEDTQALPLRLADGYRMALPKHFPASPALRALLSSCWALQPSARPSPAHLVQELSNIIAALASSR